MGEQTRAAEAGVRLDPDAVDSAWPAPDTATAAVVTTASTREEPPHAPRRRRLLLGVAVVLVLALVGTAAWAGGAFGRRTDRAWVVTPGTTITTGPFELTFDRVSVQRKKKYDDSVIWEVKAVGTGRTTGEKSVAPNLDKQRGMFAVRAMTSELFAPAQTLSIGQQDSASAFTPGLPAVPITANFELAESWREDQGLLLVVFEQELRDNSLLQDQTPSWRNAIHYYVYRLPVTRLADDLS